MSSQSKGAQLLVMYPALSHLIVSRSYHIMVGLLTPTLMVEPPSFTTQGLDHALKVAGRERSNEPNGDGLPGRFLAAHHASSAPPKSTPKMEF